MKAVWALLVIVFICWADLPDRWQAELAGPRPAIVTGYSNRGTWRRPWKIEADAEDGQLITNSDNWTFRYLDVGQKTEWTSAKGTYVGGFFMRWSIYLLFMPFILAFLAHDLVKYLRSRNEN